MLIAVLIALVASFGEVLSKYENKILRDIVNVYLFIYLAINGFFAGVAYYFLPTVATYLLKPENVSWVQGDSWGRILFAAFGYLVLVRAKFITIKDMPIGIDTLYDTFAKYCLRHTNTQINNRQDQLLDATYTKHNVLKHYEEALESRITDAPAEDRETIKTQRDTILNSKLTDRLKCKRLGQLILRIVGTQKELERALSEAANTQP